MDVFENSAGGSSKQERSQTLDFQVCELLLRLGFPVVFILPGSLEVVAWNALFADLVAASGASDHRRWFLDTVLGSMDSIDKENWIAASERPEVAAAPVRFVLKNGTASDLEMRSAKVKDDRAQHEFIACIFAAGAGPKSRKEHRSALEKGRAMERAYIRNQLHKNVSQKLLGAAFGCKILAARIEGFSEAQAKEASALAELLNGVVIDLQNLTRYG